LISGITKKVIFFSFLFINFIQPTKPAEFSKINKTINNRNTQLTWVKSPSLKFSSNFDNNHPSNAFSAGIDYIKFLNKKKRLTIGC
jgi:hypothetical protein